MDLHTRLLLPLFLVFVAGCVSNESSQSFERVQNNVQSRGGHQAHWPGKPNLRQELLDQVLADESLDAEEAVRLALVNNADLQAELDGLGIAQGELIQASLLPNPVLDVGVRFVESGGGEIIELGIAQHLLDVVLLPRRKRLAERGVEMAEQRAAASILDLAAEARTAYRRYQAQRARIDLYQHIVDATYLSADMAKRLRKAGNNIELDVLREESVYDQARLMLAEAEGEASRRRESLNALLGLWGESASGWSVPARLPIPEPLTLDPAELEPEVIRSSIDLELSRQAINMVAQQAGIEEIQTVLPDLEAGVEAEREPDGTWSVGPTLGVALPVFDWGRGVRAEQAARLRQAVNRYTGLAVRLRATARSAYTTAQTSANTSRYIREQLLPQQTRVTDETQKQFNAMQIGVFQLLSAKRSEIEMAERYLTTLEDHWAARIRLETMRMGRMPRPRFGIDTGGPMGGAATLSNPNENGGH